MRLANSMVVCWLVVLSGANVWDNIYSQTLADTPIIVSQSLNFEFKIRDNLKAKIDFNAKLEVVTMYIYLNMMVKIELIRAQLDLSNLVMTIIRLNKNQCERYNIAAMKNVSLQQPKISQQRLFLVNLFFKYIGKTEPTKFKKQVFNIYKFEPYLFSVPKLDKLADLQQQIKNKTSQDIDIDLDDYDYEMDIRLLLHINSVNGNIESIYAGDNSETTIPFKAISQIKEKFNCQAEIHSMTTEDLKGIYEFVKDNKDKL